MMQTATHDLLIKARERFSQRELGSRLGVSQKTVARWERQETTCPPLAEAALVRVLNQHGNRGVHGESEENFTFIDLFAGIGGIRMGFEDAGGRCVFTSEWNQ